MATSLFSRKAVKRIAVSICVFAIVAATFNVGKFFEILIPSLAVIDKSDEVTKVKWSAAVTLKPGDYYFSIGRAQGSCNLFHNNNLIDSNEGTEFSGRSSLILGAKISISNSLIQNLELVCDRNLGSHIRLIHEPYLQTYRVGMSLHVIRIFTDIFLPTLAILLVVFLVYFTIKEPLFLLPKAATFTGFFTIMYLTSLMNIQYLFVSNLTSVFIHSVLKVGFVFSLLSWIFSVKFISRVFTLLAFTTITTFSLLYKFYPEQLLSIYTLFVKSIPLVAFFSFCASYFYSKNATDRKLLPSILPFTLFSIFDYIAWQSASGIYLSTATTYSVFGLATFDYLNKEKAKILARKSVSIFASKQLEKSSTTESLSQIAMILSDRLKLKDWSIYIDSFNLGSSPKPGRELRRVASSNAGSLSTNSIISFDGDKAHGKTMKEAFDSKRPIVRESEDGSIYTVIPIGETCCINISDPKRSKLGEEFIKTFIEEAYQQINSLALTIIKFESTASFSITLLKEELGMGTHELEFGAIFADAIGYTQNMKSSKNFSDFFEREYIPSLLRNLDKKVILKDLFGDELYLVVLPKNLTSSIDKNIYATTVGIVQLIQEFSLGKGAELCTSAGYKPIEFRIGANAGIGQIVVSHSNVALSGPVIEAKRCQGRAHASEPFVTDILLANAPEALQKISVKETYAAKKEILTGFRISFKNKAA